MQGLLRCLFAFLIGAICGPSLAQAVRDVAGCGSLQNAFGPFDYRKVAAGDLQVVETHHFSPEVETLQHGITGPLGADIDYTLRALPNHHRALLAMIRLAQSENTGQPTGSRYSVQCWLRRAAAFAPDDAMVRTLYGSYLADQGDRAEALAQLQVAQQNAEEDINVHYNLGLAYFKLREYDLSLQHAQRAYALGFPLPGLRNKLTAVGKWRDPPASPAAEKRPGNSN